MWNSAHSGDDQVESRFWWAAAGSSPSFEPESSDLVPSMRRLTHLSLVSSLFSVHLSSLPSSLFSLLSPLFSSLFSLLFSLLSPLFSPLFSLLVSLRFVSFRKRPPFALLSHKSHCLKRKCSSTLAAETQIMSEALAEVEWIRGLFEELTNPKFSIVEWATRSRNRGLLIAARSSDAEARFPKVLSIGDAKSLYDHLRTETSFKSSGPAWTHKVQKYVGLITVACMLMQ